MTPPAPLRLAPAPPYSPQADACRQCGVRHIALFGSLDEAALENLHVRIEDIRLKPGDTLYDSDIQGHSVYTVRAGVAMLERLTPNGERRIVRLAGSGDLIGLEALLDQTYSCRAVAFTDVAVCRIPAALVRELGSASPSLTQDLMSRWQRALDEADDWLSELSSGSARERVLRLVLKFTDYFGGERIALPMREDIGAMLGMTLETASRIVSQLRREGLLVTQGGTDVTVDVAGVLAALKAGPR